MSDTGYPLKDALVSIKNQLDNKRADWKVREIHAFPAHIAGGVNIKSITMEILPETQIVATSFGIPHEFDYLIAVRITYIGPYIRAEKQYHQSLDMITNIWKYLLEHPNPDGFGTLKAVGEMTIGDIAEAAGEKVALASIDVTLNVTKTITEA